MKAVFLDIDGVLNDSNTGATKGTVGIGVDLDKVFLLSKIIENTGAKIILTSTWKMWWEKDKSKQRKDGFYLDECFSKYGISIYDKTELSCVDRGAGIHYYLMDNPEFTEWVVIDDEIFGDYEKFGILEHLVKTSFYDGGLQGHHVKKSIEMLNKNN